VACSYDIPDDLWLVDIDKGQMSQVIQNIIINARQAMPNGGTIRVSCENVPPELNAVHSLPHKDHYIEINISDTGIGMPAGILDKIFDPYFSTKQEGSGLGLAIAHSIVNKHKGFLSVQSTPAEGSTFTIHLPASTRQQEPQKEHEHIVTSVGSARIMVMDDENMIRDLAKAMLEMLGHEVVLARRGEEAIELFKKHRDSGEPIDISIMDLTVPGGMGGKLAVQEILAMQPDAKVVVSSGYSNDPIVANCQHYGFCAAIVKPYQLHEIAKVINQILSTNR
jgi:CheY-like chemotaxis protein